MDKILRFLTRGGMSRGFFGSSRAWTVVGALAITARVLKRVFGGTPQDAYSHELRPGETLVITHGKEPRVVRAPS